MPDWLHITAGNLTVRLAETEDDILQAQHLRYQTFFEEMGGVPSPEVAQQKRDFDNFDPHCDHLLVLDNDRTVVGTYRLLRQQPMQSIGRFYTESEFDITLLKEYNGNILELGRSCVAPDYRNRAVMQMLWRGIAMYCMHHNVSLMFGCGSLPEANPALHHDTLAYLYQYHLAPPSLRARALDARCIPMDHPLSPDVNIRRLFASLPPLIKGYLRAGGHVGDGAVLDHDCNTTDVCIVIATSQITEKYTQRYFKSPEK